MPWHFPPSSLRGVRRWVQDGPVPALVGDIMSLRVGADALAVVKFASAAVEKISQRRFLLGSHALSRAGKADAGHLSTSSGSPPNTIGGLGRIDVSAVDVAAIRVVAVESHATWAPHQRARLLRWRFLAGSPHR